MNSCVNIQTTGITEYTSVNSIVVTETRKCENMTKFYIPVFL